VTLRYGDEAKLRLDRSDLGGLKVSLMWHEGEQDRLRGEVLTYDRSLTG